MSQLTKILVQVKHYGRSDKSRDGYRDESNQVFLPPLKNGLEAWKEKMKKLGHTFEGG